MNEEYLSTLKNITETLSRVEANLEKINSRIDRLSMHTQNIHEPLANVSHSLIKCISCAHSLLTQIDRGLCECYCHGDRT